MGGSYEWKGFPVSSGIKWALIFGSLAALWIGMANAAPAQWYVVEWILRVTPQPNHEDCARMAADRSKQHTTLCVTAEQLAALKIKTK